MTADRPSSRIAPLLVLLALIGLGIAGYLLVVRLQGELPACPIGGGCETVQQSQYSAVAGIPVAGVGFLYSIVILGATVVWWRAADRRALFVAYGLGLLATIVIGYLSYLELFVIHAICTWCVAYGTTVVLGWLLAVLELRRSGSS